MPDKNGSAGPGSKGGIGAGNNGGMGDRDGPDGGQGEGNLAYARGVSMPMCCSRSTTKGLAKAAAAV